ncbi:MAG: hypothetical protein AAB682_02405, partial [Patescibacteria group bacterium]
ETDETINGWIKEYEAILANHSEVEAAKVDLGGGIIKLSTVGKTVDMTTLLSGLYKSGARVVLMEGEFFDKAAGKKTRQIAFGTGEKLDLLAAVKTVVPEASGFAQKVNVPVGYVAEAIEAVRHELKLKTRGLTAIAELDQKFGRARENSAE